MMTKFYKNRKEVLEELIYEIDNICDKNNLSYSLTGDIANYIYENNNFPDDLNYLTIAMTQGDIERFIDIVNNSSNNNRFVEYFLNNPHARGFQVRYCNNETTLINVKEIRFHINFGVYVRIKTIEKIPQKQFESKILKLLKNIWKGYQKSLKSCSFKYFIPSFIIKIFVNIFGKKNVANFLYNFNKKLKFIDTWEDIKKFDKVRVGNKIISCDSNWTIKKHPVNGKKVSIAEEFLNRNIEINLKKDLILINEILDLTIPFKRVLNDKNVMNYLDSSQNYRDSYLSKLSRAKKYTKNVKNAWRTYLMTRDVIDMRSYYDDDKLKQINLYLESKDYDSYLEEVRIYQRSKNKWKKLGIPFIKNDDVELLINQATKIFE